MKHRSRKSRAARRRYKQSALLKHNRLQKKASKKIRLLIREGYPQRQAIAIAMRMYGIPRKRRRRRR